MVGDAEVGVGGSEFRVGGGEVGAGELVSEDDVAEVDGDGLVGFFISSIGFGRETCGPMK